MVLGTIWDNGIFSDNICHSCTFQELSEIHDVLRNIFLIFPNYCLGRGLIDIAFNEYHNEYYFKTGELKDKVTVSETNQKLSIIMIKMYFYCFDKCLFVIIYK